MVATVSPKVRAICTILGDPNSRQAPTPTATSNKVPTNSATSIFHSFLFSVISFRPIMLSLAEPESLVKFELIIIEMYK